MSYEIVIGYDIYPANLIDNGAKIDWDKSDNGLIFKKKLDGKFVIVRSNNESLYDRIRTLSMCDVCYLRVPDPQGYSNDFVAFGVFTMRDIDYNDERCQLTIKPRYLDPNDIDTIMDRDLNIINTKFPTYTITYQALHGFEYISFTKENVLCSEMTFDDTATMGWYNDGHRNFPYIKIFNDSNLTGYDWNNYQGWTYYSQVNTLVNPALPAVPIFDIRTTWFREVKYVPKAIDLNNDMIPPQGGSAYPFSYLVTVEINGIEYNKYTRYVSNLVAYDIFDNPMVNSLAEVQWGLESWYGVSEIRTLTRARKLNNILDYFRTELNCTELRSQFFQNNVNPVSGADLTNIMIEQKSDAIFESGVESSDPARLGIITFRELMKQLWTMFQVEWTIVDNILYIEHISFFKWNFSYTPNTTIGLDLTAYYPLCLVGSNRYSYESKIPIREKFTFMEAWNIDFVGNDIEYTNCLKEGDTETYSAERITTDIDPTYLDNEASKDGFVLFHCNELNEVISEEGMISSISSANAHLSWANLHYNYWRSYRYLDNGMMNGELTTFISPKRRLKKQEPIELPFCSQNVDDLLYNLVSTKMGNGEIESAEYSFKTGNIKIELTYE